MVTNQILANIPETTPETPEKFAKTQKYLESGCLEVWLGFPEARLIMVNNYNNWLLFNPDEIITTQKVLKGFNLAVKELI